jgi:hypothetical protein
MSNRKAMKNFIFIIIALLSLSCMNLNKSEYYVSFTGNVEITHILVPDTVDIAGSAVIQAWSQAPDGCWSNLTFLLTKNSDFEYTLEAYGLYQSTGVCPPGVIYGDSAITMHPEQSGLYKFNIVKGPYDIEIDTMIVR